MNLHFGRYKFTILLLALLGFFASVLEGIGINAIIPVFSFISGGGGQTTDLISQSFAYVFGILHIPYTLRYLFVVIALLFLSKTVFLFIAQYITLSTQVLYEREMRDELFRKTLDTNWEYLSKQKLGYLEQMLIMSVEQGSKFLIHISSLVLVAAQLLVYSVVAVNISVLITVLTLLFGAVMFYGFRPLFRRNRIASDGTMKEYRKIAHYVNENILGLKSIKAGYVESKVLKKASLSFEHLRTLRLRVGLLAAFTTAILQPMPFFFILGIFAVFYKTGAFSFASFAVIVYAINRVFGNFQNLQTEIHTLVSYMPFITGAHEYRKEIEIHREEDNGTEPFKFEDTLEFKHVAFSYEEGGPVVSDISFAVKRGELLGLIGPSGSGKTTLVDLFLRLLRPQEGSILLDGTDITRIDLKDWRTNVGYVSQDMFLFNDTIADNIRFYSDTISDSDIADAAKLANIHDFIMQQPDQYQTVIGERGIKLSGGQRQRIALARVLARRPQVLILDEATSALDNESEIAVQKAIEGLRGKITVVAIAHRLSTVIESDRLIVLEGGKIVEEGSPKELLKDDASYFSKVYNIRR